MTVFIDNPVWPAHGTVWSHLISDSSLQELHEFAFRLGVPRRGFDLDHYDVPASLFDEAVRLGAVPVTGSDLGERLRDSGFRIPGKDREAARELFRDRFLSGEWVRIFDKTKAFGGATATGFEPPVKEWESLGESLLQRWSEPHRSYHSKKHLEDILLSLQQLTLHGEKVGAEELLAAWFHDAVYLGRPGEDEEMSAQLAKKELQKVGAPQKMVDRVYDYVLATDPANARSFKSDSSKDAALRLLDADVAIFASPRKRYTEYTRDVRKEYAHVEEPDFRQGRARILETYLEKPRIYATGPAHRLWEDRARENLKDELRGLAAK